MDLNREHFRAMIFYDFKVGLSRVKSLERLRGAFGDSSPSQATVYRWFREFQRGRGSLVDEERVGRPVTAATDENVLAVEQMLSEDNRMTYAQIQGALKIGSAAVKTILHEKLSVRKLSSRWIPHQLADAQKQDRVKWCQEMLQRFNKGRSEAVYNIITGDESWIYQYESENKQQSAVWVFSGETPPLKMKRGQSVGKKMLCTFFSANGHIETVTLEDQIVTAEWYTTVCLPQVFKKLETKRPKIDTKGFLLHHDSALVHSAEKTANYFRELGIQVLGHPPYSPDLAPCDFFLFPKAKESIRGQRFGSLETAIATYKEFLDSIPKEEWRAEFGKWFDRMRTCIRREGEYFEKI
ncbi:histone-lysine N-methyltransferase SETMAR-like [Osmia bicornis bicornis]|uniref:histone-lysine N-methyltransferase SETMAR-like n=1 Tax=Osmia bicornis bicornis TaxID=1437191 RepID=UPI001EAF5763|nr:histone-lysine N-methyltransferase SETMAR-like [Osmia bicornis bicornis]